jgi:hypothetical protein
MSHQHYVNYTVSGKDYQAGPYQSEAEARIHYKDIIGFVGISNCWMGNTRDEGRILIGEAQ